MKEDICSTKEIVVKVLERSKICRNSDKFLIYEVLKEMGFDIFTKEYLYSSFPSFESITRCRRKFQEEGLYLSDKK